MGIKYFSKKYKATKKNDDSLLIDNKDSKDPNAPTVLINPKVNNKRLGLDLSVILHQALGNQISAAEFQVLPKIPISKVDEVCTKLVNLARRANITLVICTDGRHHPFKQSVNATRKKNSKRAQDELNALYTKQEQVITSDVYKKMKKAVYVREDILDQALKVFKKNKVEVYGAITEADFQLVYWERTGFTDGTISVDSDIFALGSKFFVDELKVNSKFGDCKIIERDEVMKVNAFTKESSKWTDDDLLVYGALMGCDWLPRLFNLNHDKIEAFMEKWIVAKTDTEKENLLKWISTGRSWPKVVGKGKGELANDFTKRFMQCINFMKYAPVIREEDGNFKVGPLQDIPSSETQTWQELIGFDPLHGIRTIDVQACYNMSIWARTEKPLRALPLPQDPLDSTRTIPHNSVIYYDRRPIDIMPTNVLLEWLYYHGLPMPKGSSKASLVQKVKLALANKQDIDRERISLDDAVNRKSYISWETMSGVSDIIWNHSTHDLLTFIRSAAVPPVDEAYITSIFGLGKNGIRERAWKRFVSGSLDMNTLKMGTAKMEGEDRPVHIIQIKCTPSMKSEVYDVCIVFNSDGIYLPNKSKCGCPNGWLFCSHSLALFILIRLIQMKAQWSYDNLCTVMPVPIKSLQNLPISAVMVFKSRNRTTTKAVGRQIAKEVPGYSAKDDNCKDTDEKEEVAALQIDLEMKGKDVKSINMCELLDNHLKGSKDAIQIDGGSVAKDKEDKVASKVTSDDIHSFNHKIVHSSAEPSRRCETLIRHNRIQQMMNDGILSDDNALSYHLRHFEDDRKQELEQKKQSRQKIILPDQYDKEFLDRYFK